MNLQEIKSAVDAGTPVYWISKGYPVIKDKLDQYFIRYAANNDCIGLTWQDGVTLNGKETEFFTSTTEGQ